MNRFRLCKREGAVKVMTVYFKQCKEKASCSTSSISYEFEDYHFNARSSCPSVVGSHYCKKKGLELEPVKMFITIESFMSGGDQ